MYHSKRPRSRSRSPDDRRDQPYLGKDNDVVFPDIDVQRLERLFAHRYTDQDDTRQEQPLPTLPPPVMDHSLEFLEDEDDDEQADDDKECPLSENESNVPKEKTNKE